MSAFNLLTDMARDKLGIKALLGTTKTRNFKAIRLVEKMGFEKVKIDGQDTIMKKTIATSTTEKKASR